MKNILIFISLLVGELTFSQNTYLCMNTPKTTTVVKYTPQVNLNLKTYHTEKNDKGAYVCLLLSGLAFTAASILENDYNYGTWKKNPQPGNPYNQTYVTQPFWQQTPRQIMLCVGVGFTLTGVIGVLHK